jgi:hypothetical protein
MGFTATLRRVEINVTNAYDNLHKGVTDTKREATRYLERNPSAFITAEVAATIFAFIVAPGTFLITFAVTLVFRRQVAQIANAVSNFVNKNNFIDWNRNNNVVKALLGYAIIRLTGLGLLRTFSGYVAYTLANHAGSELEKARAQRKQCEGQEGPATRGSPRGSEVKENDRRRVAAASPRSASPSREASNARRPSVEDQGDLNEFDFLRHPPSPSSLVSRKAEGNHNISLQAVTLSLLVFFLSIFQ